MGAAADSQVLELHRLLACRADHLYVEFIAAPVRELDGLYAVPAPVIAPLLQGQQQWDEISARLGEQILLARRAVAVLATPYDACVTQLGEPVRQHASWYAKLRDEVDEAVVSVEQFSRNLQCVAVADHGQGICD